MPGICSKQAAWNLLQAFSALEFANSVLGTFCPETGPETPRVAGVIVSSLEKTVVN